MSPANPGQLIVLLSAAIGLSVIALLIAFAKDFILILKETKHSTHIRPVLIAMLLRSVDEFNQWRENNPGPVDLSGANLSGANLAGAALARATLRKVTFNNTNLRNANLSGSDLTQATLKGALLHGSQYDYITVSQGNLRLFHEANYSFAKPFGHTDTITFT